MISIFKGTRELDNCTISYIKKNFRIVTVKSGYHWMSYSHNNPRDHDLSSLNILLIQCVYHSRNLVRTGIEEEGKGFPSTQTCARITAKQPHWAGSASLPFPGFCSPNQPSAQQADETGHRLRFSSASSNSGPPTGVAAASCRFVVVTGRAPCGPRLREGG